jgi:hypothetical protein
MVSLFSTIVARVVKVGSVEMWHCDVASSEGFSKKNLENLDTDIDEIPALAEIYESCLPHYEALHPHRIH